MLDFNAIVALIKALTPLIKEIRKMETLKTAILCVTLIIILALLRIDNIILALTP